MDISKTKPDMTHVFKGSLYRVQLRVYTHSKTRGKKPEFYVYSVWSKSDNNTAYTIAGRQIYGGNSLTEAMNTISKYVGRKVSVPNDIKTALSPKKQ